MCGNKESEYSFFENNSSSLLKVETFTLNGKTANDQNHPIIMMMKGVTNDTNANMGTLHANNSPEIQKREGQSQSNFSADRYKIRPDNLVVNNIQHIPKYPYSDFSVPKKRILAVFYHGGPDGDGNIKPDTKDSGGTGTIYNATAMYAKQKGLEFKGAIIAPSLTQGKGVNTGGKFLEDNYQPGDIVIMYGYSYGGDNAVNMAEEMYLYPIDLMVIVDSSDGPLRGLTVDTEIPNNVFKAYNFYQERISGSADTDMSDSSRFPASRGYPHVSKGGINNIENFNVSGENVTHGNIQTVYKDTIMTRIYERIDEVINENNNINDFLDEIIK